MTLPSSFKTTTGATDFSKRHLNCRCVSPDPHGVAPTGHMVAGAGAGSATQPGMPMGGEHRDQVRAVLRTGSLGPSVLS